MTTPLPGAKVPPRPPEAASRSPSPVPMLLVVVAVTRITTLVFRVLSLPNTTRTGNQYYCLRTS